MRSPLSRALRDAAASVLPPRAFLKRDRGDALFVTDAMALQPETDWAAALHRAGFDCAASGDLLRLWPGAAWLTRLERACPQPPDALSQSLFRFAGRPPDGESLALFALGARALDGGVGADRFDRLLRRRAAECLRLNQTTPTEPMRGGGLYACALLEHIIKEENAHETQMTGTFLF